jgi:hypothetical protein
MQNHLYKSYETHICMSKNWAQEPVPGFGIYMSLLQCILCIKYNLRYTSSHYVASYLGPFNPVTCAITAHKGEGWYRLLPVYLPTWSSLWEANIGSVSQDIPHLLQNLKVHYPKPAQARLQTKMYHFSNTTLQWFSTFHNSQTSKRTWFFQGLVLYPFHTVRFKQQDINVTVTNIFIYNIESTYLFCIKIKQIQSSPTAGGVKVVLVLKLSTMPWRHKMGVEVYFHAFLTSA